MLTLGFPVQATLHDPNTHPSPLVESSHATYDLPTTSILSAAALVNFETTQPQQDHDQVHDQHQCRYWHERSEVRRDDQFQVPGINPVQEWHLSRNPHQDCLSNGSNSQTKQDLAVQHHQLRKQVQGLQVSCHSILIYG